MSQPATLAVLHDGLEVMVFWRRNPWLIRCVTLSPCTIPVEVRVPDSNQFRLSNGVFASMLTTCLSATSAEAALKVEIDVSAGRLSTALVDLGRQAGVPIIMVDQGAADVRTRGVKGAFQCRGSLAAPFGGDGLRSPARRGPAIWWSSATGGQSSQMRLASARRNRG